MKKIFGKLSLMLRPSRANVTAVGTSVVTLLVVIGGHVWSAPSEPDFFRSVELGLAEVSPAGEEGGYAIPASGESSPSCTMTFEDRVGTNGQTYKAVVVNWSWGDWMMIQRYQIARCSLATHGTISGCNSAGSWWATPPWTRLHENNSYNHWRSGLGIAQPGGPLVVNSNSSSLAPGQYYYRVNARSTGSDSHGFATNITHPPNHATLTCGAILTVGDDITPPPPPPGALEVELQIAKIGTNTWGSSVSLSPGEEAKVRWQTTNATTCTALPPVRNFQPTIANSGWLEDTTIDEPPTNQSYQYRLNCSNGAGQSLTRTVSASVTSGPISYPPPTITVSERFVPRGTSVRIDWNITTNPPDSCVLTGPGLNVTPVTPAQGHIMQTVYNESTYTIECPGGSASVRVLVLPIIEET